VSDARKKFTIVLGYDGSEGARRGWSVSARSRSSGRRLRQTAGENAPSKARPDHDCINMSCHNPPKMIDSSCPLSSASCEAPRCQPTLMINGAPMYFSTTNAHTECTWARGTLKNADVPSLPCPLRSDPFSGTVCCALSEIGAGNLHASTARLPG
jgi:hypothetical protein